MPRSDSILALAALLPFVAASLAFAQEHHGEPHRRGEPHGHSAELNDQFHGDVDVQKFIDRFESGDREIFLRRDDILKTLDLAPGLAVADVGAGTGLFAFPIAGTVGPKGIVYAVDVSPAFIELLGRRAKERGLETTVKPILGANETTNLAPDSVDLAFVCATYHHFEKPAPILASIHRALRPGGRLVVVDFDLRPDSSDFVRERARAPREVYFREIEAAGFERLKAETDLKMKDNFHAVFRRAEPKPAS